MEADLILECVVGSTLHGVSVDDGLEDLDIMGIAVESMSNILSFKPQDTWVTRTKPMGVRSEAGDVDCTVYGLRKFLSLALKGNPSILLALFAPPKFVQAITPLGEELKALYPKIVSTKLYGPYGGYMRQQHERLLGLRGQRNVTRPELVAAYGYDTKYAGHIIRLGYQGAELLKTGKLTLPMETQERLNVVKVRTGGYTMEEISELIVQAEDRLTAAYKESQLPSAPDYDHVEKWMIDAYTRNEL